MLHFLEKMLAYLKNTLLLRVKMFNPNINKMNKIELIDAVAEKAGMTKVDARKAVDAILDAAKGELKNDGKVALVGFGTLAVATRPERKGRNPKTGKPIKIASKKVVKFKAASNLLK